MTLPSFITAIKVAVLVLAFVTACSAAPRIAILTPDGTAASKQFAGELSQRFDEMISVIDSELAESAFNAHRPIAPFNMTAEEAKLLGRTIGCDLFLVVRAVNQRRNAAGRNEYYEAYAPIYLVSARTGRLVFWDLRSQENEKTEAAWNDLINSAAETGKLLSTRAQETLRNEAKETAPPVMEEPPDDNSSPAKNFKAPIPFRRIKPDYTDQASAYEIAATVEITVDLDAAGKILRTEITRWAGFGLDESVERSVRQMNWRAAERDGKFLPMRFLLRYNFKKIPKE